MKYDTQHPHIASYIVLRKDGKIAFVHRANTTWMNNHYGLPSGKVETGESFEQAAVREAKEEVGVTISLDKLTQVLTVHRYEEGDAPEWIDIYFEASSWDGEVINAEPEIHSELAWLDPKNLPENTIPAVKVAVKAIETGERYIEYGWK